MNEELSRSVVKAQNAVAVAAWDVMRCKEAIKEAEAHLAKCHQNLQQAAIRHGELASQYEKTHDSWRLAVVESHRPPASQNTSKGVE
jgi:hypothetical protein